MSRDLHDEPFDDGTKAKLSIFKDYLKEWLPVFLSKREPLWNTINIFDFFSGPGSDVTGVKGTPLIIIDELKPYANEIKGKRLQVNLYFNEYRPEKYKTLKSLLGAITDSPYSIKIDNLDFKSSFSQELPRMQSGKCANLLFLDQSGIKHIDEDTFKVIVNIKRTDFLFFTSSSTVKRFSDHPNISKYLDLNPELIENTDYHKIHRLIVGHYKSLIPNGKHFYLAPFSLKKPSGVYGLIFGSSHLLGIEKFLTTCWNNDPARGEANFDIDQENIIPGQFDIFSGTVRRPKKVELFEKELKEQIISKKLQNDKEIYLFTLENGFIPSHAREVIQTLIKEKLVSKCKLNLTHNICKQGSKLTRIQIL